MKKYAKPTAKLVKLDSTTILAGSNMGVNDTPTNSMLSKRGYFYVLD